MVVAFVVVAFVALTLGRPAVAQTPRDVAHDLDLRATTEYRLGYFANAAKLYEDAYRVVQDPALLYNIGQAQRMAGSYERALVAYRSYLKTAPPDAPSRELASKRVDELEQLLAARRAGAAAGDTRSPPPAFVPGVETLTMLASNQPAVALVDAGANATSAPAPRASSRQWWLWGAVGVVVAGVAATWLVTSRAPEVRSGSAGTAVVP